MIETIIVFKAEIGERNTRYGSPMRRLQRQVEPLVTLVDFPTVQASKLSVKGHTVTVYREGTFGAWSSDYESVTKYAPRREVKRANNSSTIS